MCLSHADIFQEHECHADMVVLVWLSHCRIHVQKIGRHPIYYSTTTNLHSILLEWYQES